LAVNCFRTAANAGYPPAMNQLGIAYAQGKGVSKDLQQAQSWFRKSADAGEPLGMLNLADALTIGLAGPPDQDEGKKWYAKAVEKLERSADDDDRDAMIHLALLHQTGRAVAAD